MNNDKLAEFLSKHKLNCENFNEEGNYDPNPYWLADEIVEFLNLQNVSQQRKQLLAFGKELQQIGVNTYDDIERILDIWLHKPKSNNCG